MRISSGPLAGWVLLVVSLPAAGADSLAAATLSPEFPAGQGRGSAAAAFGILGGDGAFLLAWEVRAGAEADVLFSRREPGEGGAWLDRPRRLDTDEAGAARSLEPRLAAGSGERVFAVWQDSRSGNDDIRFNRSADGGSSWLEEDLRLNTGTAGEGVASMPALAADRHDHVYVAWEDRRDGCRDIRLNRSTDAGRTWWSEDRKLDSDEAGSGISYHPQIVAWEDGSVLVCWWDERDGLADLYVRRSTDAGETWPEAEVRLDPGEAGRAASHDARLAVAGNHILVVWEELGAEEWGEILVCVSTDRGASWGGKTPDWSGTHLAEQSGQPGRSPAAWIGTDGSGCLAWVASCPPRFLVSSRIWADGVARVGDVARIGLSAFTEGGPWLGGGGGTLWLAWAHRIEPERAADDHQTPIGILEREDRGGWVARSLIVKNPNQSVDAPGERAHSLTGAVTAEGVLHLAWVRSDGQSSQVRAIRLEPAEETAGEADERADHPGADQSD